MFRWFIPVFVYLFLRVILFVFFSYIIYLVIHYSFITCFLFNYFFFICLSVSFFLITNISTYDFFHFLSFSFVCFFVCLCSYYAFCFYSCKFFLSFSSDPLKISAVRCPSGRPCPSLVARNLDFEHYLQTCQASFFTVWQHRHLSEQIRPWGTLACCGDVKKPTNKQANK